jgi:hypothetical protein
MIVQFGFSLQSLVCPDERILWIGYPDAKYRQQRDANHEVWNAVRTVLVVAALFYFILLWRTLGAPFVLGNFLQLIAMISVLPLTAIGIVVLVRRRKQKPAKFIPAEPPLYLFIVTNQRALIYQFDFLSTTSVLLAQVRVQLDSQSRGYGDIVFYPNTGDAAPKMRRFSMQIPAFTFGDVPNASEVYQLILDTKNRLGYRMKDED